MHGEYKMPGGKLIVADLEVHAGHLAKVSISGDFFLEPDTVLATLNAALEGLPADSDEAAMTRVIQSTLDEEVVMYGISAQAVAVVVRRALEACL